MSSNTFDPSADVMDMSGSSGGGGAAGTESFAWNVWLLANIGTEEKNEKSPDPPGRVADA